eukprot:CAMPEP_0115240882 /NCGR_PEP_ID=MMETSP0270-20121206/38141_1 /TAXON_ID=71861 /ORGANISM="Scrippsiella trochoidea, Strain CCMP3099" /LENGTH=140 /DNA_ID=CAMNT_0002655881 /DNA_START=122 /DNA_END=544 /DNA_ORIENTATION=-
MESDIPAGHMVVCMLACPAVHLGALKIKAHTAAQRSHVLLVEIQRTRKLIRCVEGLAACVQLIGNVTSSYMEPRLQEAELQGILGPGVLPPSRVTSAIALQRHLWPLHGRLLLLLFLAFVDNWQATAAAGKAVAVAVAPS